jgi:hypothetical protein
LKDVDSPFIVGLVVDAGKAENIGKIKTAQVIFGSGKTIGEIIPIFPLTIPSLIIGAYLSALNQLKKLVGESTKFCEMDILAFNKVIGTTMDKFITMVLSERCENCKSKPIESEVSEQKEVPVVESGDAEKKVEYIS